jgi:hypothetical protein
MAPLPILTTGDTTTAVFEKPVGTVSPSGIGY